MDLIRREAVLEILENGKVTIDEDALDCQNAYEMSVYLLEKIEQYLESAVCSIPSVEAVPVENIERIVERLKKELPLYTGKAIEIVREEGGL